MINFKDQSILIIAAHPDDEVLGCGGLISRYNNFSNINVVFLGEGSSCRFSETNSEFAKNSIKQREEAARNAARLLKIKNTEFYNLPCGRLDQFPIIEINKIIEAAILKYLPNILLTHDANDVNNDHRIIYKSTLMSTRPQSETSVEAVLTYEVPSSSECSFQKNQFSPNYFIEISESNLRSKFEALSQYSSEIKPFPFPRSFEGIKAYSQFRGMQSAVEYAEGFNLVRYINHAS